jgi:hypothetical protein
MIHAPTLLVDLKRWVTRFEDDLRQQCKDVPALDARLKAQYKQAKDAGRTAFSYAVWRDGELTQSAVGWVLSCVFVRFLEDNELLERSFISGVGENRGVADETRAAYFRENRAASDNDYLAHVMSEVGKLPGMADLMDARHNALWNAAISPDAAKAFIEFWRRIDPGTGKMAHEFTDSDWDTRFLGDLYQDLSESARKKFALLQTPDFVEEFILDRTLDPAINTFGLKVVRMIDPTCGSGHFLLGGFRRLLALWEKQRPDLSDKERAVKALDGVFGVDINPFAVAIARFRLLLAAWRYCGVKRLRSAPDFKVNLATGDSLIHGARFDSEGKPYVVTKDDMFGGDDAAFKDETAHHFEVEDAKELHRILGQQYHAVVGNPPYITVKDRSVSELYRARYHSCHRQYSLSVPFMERFFDLAVRGDLTLHQPAGFTGQITANSFMKREFGKKLIEEYLPRWDLTHVLDTAGAYIPGHGTPTVILFGKNQLPLSGTIRTVLGIRGEPSTPAEPALGLVWQAITKQIDQPGSESEWMSAADSVRTGFHRHPWSIGGGGASELKQTIEEVAAVQLGSILCDLGRTTHTGADEIFYGPVEAFRTRGLSRYAISLIIGEDVRDFTLTSSSNAIFPYNPVSAERLEEIPSSLEKYFWPNRTLLKSRKDFGQFIEERGLRWWEHSMLFPERYRRPLSIAFAEVASHNHFALDLGGKVFKQTAPVIKLPPQATKDDHVALVALLNSSVICFMMKQTSHQKQMTGGDGVRVDTKAKVPYQFSGTQLQKLPIPELFLSGKLRDRILALGVRVERTVRELEALSSPSVIQQIAEGVGDVRILLEEIRVARANIRSRLILLQEQIDFTVYVMFSLAETETIGEEIDEIPLEIEAGQRPFEIVRGENIDGFPVAETVPVDWAALVKAIWQKRIVAIRQSPALMLIEEPHYKRRWIGRQGLFNHARDADEFQGAARDWLLARLEAYFHESDCILGGDDATKSAVLDHLRPIRAIFAGSNEPKIVSVRQLAHVAQTDSQWMEAATVFAGRADFDVAKIVETLVLAESVPALPAQRYKAAGLRKREEWENTWELQRAEDAVEEEVRGQKSGVSEEELKKKIRKAQLEKVGDIPVPPKYGSGDFLKSTYWKLRGKLDVPKERWVLYPGMEGGHDASPVIAWAGWDHAQQAAALTGFYQQAKETWGWEPQKLAPLLAALKELLPWLHQWHNAIDPEYGDRPCDSFQQFYTTELHTLRLTDEEIERLRMGNS